MARILFGLLAPLIITIVVWFIGSPPALSLFWQDDDAVIVGHETFEAETGYGAYPFHMPLVQIEGRSMPFRMTLPGAPNMDEVKTEWPLGQTVRVKINPSETYVTAVNDPRRNYLAQIVVLVLGLAIIGLTLASYFIALNTASLATGALGLVFIIIPLLITWGRWQIGHPPPTAHILWPTENVGIISQDIISRRIGNGTIRHTPIIHVMRPNIADPVQVDGYRGGFKRDADRVLNRQSVGDVMKVNISPQGIPFEARWDVQQIATVILTAILPFFLFIGLILLRISIPSRRRRP